MEIIKSRFLSTRSTFKKWIVSESSFLFRFKIILSQRRPDQFAKWLDLLQIRLLNGKLISVHRLWISACVPNLSWSAAKIVHYDFWTFEMERPFSLFCICQARWFNAFSYVELDFFKTFFLFEFEFSIFLYIISEHKQWFGWCCHWMRTNSCMEFIRRINSHHSDMSWSVPEHIDHKANSFLLPRHWSWNSVYYVVKWMCLLLQQKPWVLVRDSFGFLMNRFDSIPLFFFQGSHWTAAIQ